MQPFAWSDKYSVNNEVIDNQHKKLFSIIGQLHQSMKDGTGQDVLNKIFNDLVIYTKDHFRTEEKMMKQADYPNYFEHEYQHQELTEKVVSLQEDFKKGKASLSLEVMDFLKHWLVDHIQDSDQRYKNKI